MGTSRRLDLPHDSPFPKVGLTQKLSKRSESKPSKPSPNNTGESERNLPLNSDPCQSHSNNLKTVNLNDAKVFNIYPSSQNQDVHKPGMESPLSSTFELGPPFPGPPAQMLFLTKGGLLTEGNESGSRAPVSNSMNIKSMDYAAGPDSGNSISPSSPGSLRRREERRKKRAERIATTNTLRSVVIICGLTCLMIWGINRYQKETDKEQDERSHQNHTEHSHHHSTIGRS